MVGTVIVTVPAPCTVPAVAVMVEVPPARPVTRPPAETEATPGVLEVHATDAVTSLLVPSE